MRVTNLPDLPQASTDVIQRINHSTKGESPLIPKPEVKVPEAGKEQLSQKYADWAKKETQLRSKIQAEKDALKKAQDEFAAKQAEYSTGYIRKSDIPTLFQRDASQALKELGLSGDTLTQALLNQPSPQDLMIQDLKAEVAALKGSLEKVPTMFSERDGAAEQQALGHILTEVKSLVASDPQFEIIKKKGLEQEVVNEIHDHFKKTGQLLNVEEGAAQVEKDILEGLTDLLQIDKIKALIQPAAPVKTAIETKPSVKTLANSQVASAQRPMSARERAIAIMEGKLNS